MRRGKYCLRSYWSSFGTHVSWNKRAMLKPWPHRKGCRIKTKYSILGIIIIEPQIKQSRKRSSNIVMILHRTQLVVISKKNILTFFICNQLFNQIMSKPPNLAIFRLTYFKCNFIFFLLPYRLALFLKYPFLAFRYLKTKLSFLY